MSKIPLPAKAASWFPDGALPSPSVSPSQRLEDAVAGLGNAAGAQGEHQVAITGCVDHGVYAILHRSDVFHRAMPESARPLGQRLRSYALDRLLRSRVDIHQKEAVGLVKGAGELVHQELCTRVAVRLEQHQDPAVSTETRRFQRRSNFCRMMAVVVDYSDAALDASDLKTPIDSAEIGQ